MDKLRKRFVMFNLLVIGSIILIVGFLMFIGNGRDESSRHLGDGSHRLWVTIVAGLLLVFLGSLFLSKKAVEPIEKAWQKQLDFTADASHELRTPLAVMGTNLELVMDSPDETVASQMKWLKNIEAENKRMTRLVADLLTLSRSDTHQQELELETFRLDEMILDTVASFEVMASHKEITLITQVDNDLAFTGDRKRIEQLVVILVDNAIKHMNQSGMVTITLNQSGKELELTVADTGVGIEAHHLAQIFDRFYRVEKKRTADEDGSGLGLAIAKWIVEAHGGNISVTSALGEGTVFQCLFMT